MRGPGSREPGEQSQNPMNTQTDSNNPGAARDWKTYFDKTAGRPPRDTLLLALDVLGPGAGRIAVDLGCGAGRDAIELLRRGWVVFGVDAAEAAIEGLRRRPDLPPGAGLATCLARFEDTTWPAPVMLVNASFSLPMAGPTQLAAVWQRIHDSLAPGGLFAGQLFGDRDSFAGREGLACISEPQARAMLDGWDILQFREEETDSTTPFGEDKHWHLFHVVARRR